MKRLCFLLMALALPLVARGAETEEDLLRVLQSDQSLQEKAAACAQLKWIGTPKSVPVLAELLTNGDLSHSARYALESMPGPEAEEALRHALAKTTGSNQVGIIDSLGVRGEAAAVTDLANLLASPETNVAVATAHALGRLHSSAVMDELHSAWAGSSQGRLHDAETDGLLACADQSMTSGGGVAAAKIFKEIYDKEKDPATRMAAFRGLILSSEKQGIVLMVNAIKGDDGPSQGAALQLASRVGGSATTKALATAMHTLSVPMQIALLQCLAQRGDRTAAPYVLELLESPDANVRMATIKSLGALGGSRDEIRLAVFAANATGEEKTAAREALADMGHGAPVSEVLSDLAKSPQNVQLELIRTLGARGESAAAPKLVELARGTNDEIRSASLQALPLIAGSAELPGLIQLIVSATNEDARGEAADALSATLQRVQGKRGNVEGIHLVDAVKNSPLEARVALLGVCGGISDAQSREAIRVSLNDPDERIRAAAVRALCSSQDEQLLPDMAAMATTVKNPKYRTMAIRAGAQLIKQDKALAKAKKIDALKALLGAASDAEEKRLVLSGLAAVPDLETLSLAGSLLDQSEVKVEASDASVAIAKVVSRKHPEEAIAALNRIVAQPVNDAARKSAEDALKKIKPVN